MSNGEIKVDGGIDNWENESSVQNDVTREDGKRHWPDLIQPILENVNGGRRNDGSLLQCWTVISLLRRWNAL